MNKMTLADIKSYYGKFVGNEKPGRDGLLKTKRATQKNRRHTNNPVWLPGAPDISPSEYRRRHLGKRR